MIWPVLHDVSTAADTARRSFLNPQAKRTTGPYSQRLAPAVRSRSLLKAASWDQILAPVHLNNSETFGYGFGFSLDPWQEHPRIYHNGQLPGFLTVLEDFPDDRFTIIAMRNTDEFDIAKVVQSIAGFESMSRRMTR